MPALPRALLIAGLANAISIAVDAVVVIKRAGANGAIGTAAVRAAKPDGATLLLGPR